MNKAKYINLSTLGKDYVGILLSNKEEIMKAYQEKMPIMTYILKEKNPNNPPKYFLDFKDEMTSFKEKVESFINEQKEFNKQVLEFMVEQRKINNLIIDKLEKLDSRIDNLVSKNNLKE